MNNLSLDEQLCRQCRGRCCQGHPGVWSDPQRFFTIFFAGDIPLAESLGATLQKRRLALRDLGGVLIPAPQETEQGCRFRLETGCCLSIQERPCQCLALSPQLETLLDDQIHCQIPADYSSGAARENWRPFQTLLKQVHFC